MSLVDENGVPIVCDPEREDCIAYDAIEGEFLGYKATN